MLAQLALEDQNHRLLHTDSSVDDSTTSSFQVSSTSSTPLLSGNNDEQIFLPSTTTTTTSILSRPQPKKSVSFLSFLKAITVLHINDYTEKEIENTWFSRTEYMVIRSDITRALVEMKQNHQEAPAARRLSQDKHWFCPCGPEGKERKRRVRHHAIAAVLDQQELQRKEGRYEPDLLAQVYNSVTRRCHEAARMMGAREEENMIRRKALSDIAY
jgi:hypothetical protein